MNKFISGLYIAAGFIYGAIGMENNEVHHSNTPFVNEVVISDSPQEQNALIENSNNKDERKDDSKPKKNISASQKAKPCKSFKT